MNNWTRYFVGWAAGWLMCLFAVAYVPGGLADQEKAAVAHKATPDTQAKILRIQLQSERLQKEYQACQTRDWNAQVTGLNAQMQLLIDEAFKEAKLDKKDYDLNFDTFEFVKKPPVPPAAKPEEKKP